MLFFVRNACSLLTSTVKYKPITLVQLQNAKGAVFAPFCLKMGIKFAHFGLELGMIFERTTEVYERTLQLHPRLTSVFWSLTFKTAAPQIVTDNAQRKRVSNMTIH